jgi:spore coat protein U-like protein
MNKLNMAAVLLLAGYSAGAMAFISATDNFEVTATVSDSCSVTANDLDFGAYDPIGVNVSADLPGSTTVSATCTAETAYTVTLSAGASGTTVQRYMDNGTDHMNYNLYTDAGHADVWQDTDTSGTPGVDYDYGTGDGTEQSYTVYGLVPMGQTGLSAGSYTDTITVSVNY